MDIKKLLSSFNAHDVTYVVIGAAAFPVHGYDRSTQDIDLFIEPTEKNALRALAALTDVGYDVTPLTLEVFLQKKTLFRQYILDTDIHPYVAGATFTQVWKHRVQALWNGIYTCFASLDDLIAMKKAAGRAKDLEDLRYLEKIRALRKQKRRPRR